MKDIKKMQDSRCMLQVSSNKSDKESGVREKTVASCKMKDIKKMQDSRCMLQVSSNNQTKNQGSGKRQLQVASCKIQVKTNKAGSRTIWSGETVPL
jgi:hypothetical protein